MSEPSVQQPNLWRECFGWVSVTLILGAFITAKMWPPVASHWGCDVANIVGSAGIIVVSGSRRNWQPLVLNVVWLVVSLLSLVGLRVSG